MSEVKRYHVTEAGLVEGQALGRINVVLGADHDRVTADADRLRAELECSRGDFAQLERISDALQQRLTAADERVDVLEGLLRKAHPFTNDVAHDVDAWLEIDAALNPADPAKDERVCPGCGMKGWTACCTQCVPY